MIRSIAIVWALIGACACSRPSQTPPGASGIYFELVEAGCMAPSDSGVASVAEGLASDAAPSWFSCLAEGGTVSGCAVPCGP